jgi:hypothetical protein
MTFLLPQRPAPTVTLTRADVEAIVIEQMGWEDRDVTMFWFLARHRKPAGGQP